MSIKLTEKAIQEVKSVMAEQQFALDEYCLEVGVRGGGCSGFAYKLGFKKLEETDLEKDVFEEFDGVKTVTNNKAMLYLDGVTIDYHDGLNKRGFVFDNPSVKSTCGCGSSFSM